jgi:hypothetical protein
MKKLFYLLLVPFIAIGCNENALQPPSNISNINTRADTGGVAIFWNIPADSDYTYVEVSTNKYLDNPDSGQIFIKKASIYADSVVFKGLLHKYKYIFKVQTFNVNSDNQKRGRVFKTNPVRPIRRPISIKYIPDSLTKIKIDPNLVSAASTYPPKKNKVANLFDGNKQTIWQSDYRGGHNHPAPFYIRINFKQEKSVGALKYVERTGFKDRGVTQFAFEISNDGKKWTQVWKSKPNLPTLPKNKLRTLHFDKNYISKHFRVVIAATKGNKWFAALSELRLYRMKTKKIDLEKKAEKNY